VLAEIEPPSNRAVSLTVSNETHDLFFAGTEKRSLSAGTWKFSCQSTQRIKKNLTFWHGR
jgi:hypothetical protein